MTQVDANLDPWLATLDADTLQTIERRPSGTIVPTTQTGRRVALLDELAKRGAVIELRQGAKLGEGGMGVVHEAEQVALGRTVAVKSLKPESEHDPSAAQDLLREAWITGALEHPSVVPVHHLEVDERMRPLVILKRVDGTEWHKLITSASDVQHRFGATDLLAWNLGILGQVLNALRFAHSRGILHRDLKPSNVMIGHFGEVYLLDWGLAVALEDDGTGRFPLAVHATELAGTPSYMAPEMLGRGGAPLSVATDVYLAGAVLYELICGYPPHRGTSVMALVASIAASTPEFPADVPVELAQICAKAMHVDPAKRHASIAVLQLALQRFLEHRGSERLAAGAKARLAELLELTRATTASTPELRETIYRQLAIVRFAFHEALAVWRDNAQASAGLTAAANAVAEYELDRGDPRAAVALLSELPERSALLARAQDAVATQTAQHRSLEALRDEHAPTLVHNARWMAIIVGLFVTVVPMLGAVFNQLGAVSTHGQQLWWTTGWLVVVVLVLWRSRWRTLNALNRRVLLGAVLLFASQLVLEIGAWRAGISLAQTRVIMLFLYAVVLSMFAITTDARIMVACVGYYAAFLIAAILPAYVLYIMSAGNFVFTCVVWWQWRPAR